MARFGETVEGYTIPVLNEREVRAGAGLFFLLMFIAITNVIYTGSFVMLKYAVIAFLTDFIIRVFFNTNYAPSLVISKWIVRKQVPEYVGAAQKKFAWIIGLVLGVIMLVLLVIVNSFSPITGLICFICLIFLFFESAFGICLGCWFYRIIKKEKAQYCPGEVCDIHDRHAIQKTNVYQWLVVLAFIGFIVLNYYLFNDYFSQESWDLFGLESAASH